MHPGDRCRGLDAVRHAEVGERRLEGRRRRPHQGAAPDQPGRAAQQGFPDLPRRIEAAGDEVDAEQKGGDDVRRGLVGREPLPPSLRRVEDEAAGQVPAPALRQGAEGRAVSGDGPGQAQHAIAIEAVQQQVGQGRAGLAVAGRQGAPSVREVHVDVRLGRERQDEVVVVARRRGRDGDVARRDAAGEMAASPAESLHHLVTRAGAARDRHLGPRGNGGLDRHLGGPDPVGHSTGPRRPTGRDGPGDRQDEGTPAGVDLRHGAELHLAQHPGGVAQPLDRPSDEVGRPAHPRREAIQRRRFDARQGRQALIASGLGARREVDAGRPCLRQGRAERRREAGKSRDGREIGQAVLGHLRGRWRPRRRAGRRGRSRGESRRPAVPRAPRPRSRLSRAVPHGRGRSAQSLPRQNRTPPQSAGRPSMTQAGLRKAAWGDVPRGRSREERRGKTSIRS